MDCSDTIFSEIIKRVYRKGITFREGLIGNSFEIEYFLKEPIRNERKEQVEFQVRICQFNTNSVKAINTKKCDDLFFVTDMKKPEYSNIDKQDINIEIIETNNLEELKFVLGLSKII